MRPDADEGEKRTNEIGTVIPLLETVPDIAGRTVTADALLTQRALASYLLGRSADYMFTVKGNQPTLNDDIRLLLDETIARRAPDFTDESPKPEHGRRERRSIWVSSELNDYLNFPGVGQVFAVRRETVEVKSGKRRCETAYGVTSLSAQAASPERLLSLNRGHWAIEATHHILDWSFDEDRSRIRSGHGPENMTLLRRFAIGLIKARGLAVAETMRNLARNRNSVKSSRPTWPRNWIGSGEMVTNRNGRLLRGGGVQDVSLDFRAANRSQLARADKLIGRTTILTIIPGLFGYGPFPGCQMSTLAQCSSC